MSLDIGLIATVTTSVVSENITHNLNKMWLEAGIYDALYMSAGKKAIDVLPVLENGLKQMDSDPERFKKFDAPNGWGTYRQALPWLAELIEQFKAWPDGEIWVSK